MLLEVLMHHFGAVTTKCGVHDRHVALAHGECRGNPVWQRPCTLVPFSCHPSLSRRARTRPKSHCSSHRGGGQLDRRGTLLKWSCLDRTFPQRTFDFCLIDSVEGRQGKTCHRGICRECSFWLGQAAADPSSFASFEKQSYRSLGR